MQARDNIHAGDLICDNCGTQFFGGRFDYDTPVHHCHECRDCEYAEATVTMRVTMHVGALSHEDALKYAVRSISPAWVEDDRIVTDIEVTMGEGASSVLKTWTGNIIGAIASSDDLGL